MYFQEDIRMDRNLILNLTETKNIAESFYQTQITIAIVIVLDLCYTMKKTKLYFEEFLMSKNIKITLRV